MKLLVIGSGGREHAMVWKLAQSPMVTKIWCAPGNAGIAAERCVKSSELVECVEVGADDVAGLLALANEKGIDFTVVGPDNPLALGVVDEFIRGGRKIWGPNRAAAQFESSKGFSQAFMERHRIPTARAGVFEDAALARQFAAQFDGRCAVKADGLVLGKGVLLCSSYAEAVEAIDSMLIKKAYGAAGARVVIQEMLEGMEISLHALCDGKTAKLFPTSQDHKRALDGDLGLNTGGMGTYSPTPFLSEAELRRVEADIVDPWLSGCAAEGIDYRGVLYPGVMLTATGPKVLEFNSRFGDPEAQVYMPKLESDLCAALCASCHGELDGTELNWNALHCVCVVMASAGYPGAYPKGKRIDGLAEVARMNNVKVFHAGTARTASGLVTNGGRVLGVTAWGATLNAARSLAASAVERIHFEGAQFRRDIGAKAVAVRDSRKDGAHGP